MSDQRNYAALDWVLGEIEETLKEARQALEAYVENPKDATQLRFCVTHIHQVRGSLQIVEFHGASLLAEEMELLAQALMGQKVTSIDEAQEVLMRALLQLPIYLDHVKVYRDDTARSILPLLNDIRALRKESYLSESNLFSPDLSALDNVVGQRHPALADTEKLKQVTGKLREMYQFAAASVLRNIKVKENLEYLEKVFARLVVLTSGTKNGPLWLIASALIEGLKNESIESSIAVKGLLRYLARELRLLSEGVPQSFDKKPAEGLIKNLLYYVASSEAQTAQIQEIKTQYCLNKSDVGKGEEHVDGYNVSALDPDAVRSVVTALREELKSIKSNLDAALSSQVSPPELKEVLPVVKRVADTLAVLGIRELRETMLLQSEFLSELSDRNSLDESGLMESAGHIIDVDSKLEAISKAVDRHRDIANIDERNIEIDEAKLAVLTECQIGLEKVKDAIIEYVSSQWDTEKLTNIDHLLKDIRGGLDMVPLSRAAGIIERCASYIVEQLVQGQEQPSWESLDALADAMASIEYYLERLSKDISEDASNLLDMAEQSVATLGYAVGEHEHERDSQDEGAASVIEPEHLEQTAAAVTESTELAQTDEGIVSEPESEPTEAPLAEEIEADESEIDNEIIEIFIEEAQEVLETLGEYLPKWLANINDEDSLTIVRRAYHTLKGSGRIVEAMEIGELSWSVENMLNRVIDGSAPYQDAHGQLVQAVTKLLPTMIEAFKTGTQNPEKARADEYHRWAFSLAEGVIPEGFNINLDESAAPSETAEESDVAVDDSDDDDYVLLEIFSSEVETHLNTMRDFIARMDAEAPIYGPPSDELQRALHTLKGSAKMAQVTPIARLYEVLEAFAKEMVTFQVNITDDVLQLKRDAVSYTEEALRQIQAREPVHIEKLEQFLARTAELRELNVGHLVRMKEMEKDGERPVDPRLLSIFMAEDMKLLLDADEIVEAWYQQPEATDKIPDLIKELETLALGADQAKLPDMSGLAVLLSKVYGELLNKLSSVNEEARSQLQKGHAALLDMVDAVAAGQIVQSPSPELVESIQAYLEQLRTSELSEPAAQSDLSDLNPSSGLIESTDVAEEGSDADSLNVDEVPSAELGQEDVNQTDASASLVEDTSQELELDSAHSSEELSAESLPADEATELESSAAEESLNLVDDESELVQPETIETEAKHSFDEVVETETPEVEVEPEPAQASEAPSGHEQEVAEASVEPEAIGAYVHEGLLDEIDAESEDFDADILEVFVEECDELFEELDEDIHSWEANQDLGAVEGMKRALHTMKGGARLSGMTVLGDLIHDYESFILELDLSSADESTFAKVHDYQDRIYKGVGALKHFLGSGETQAQPDASAAENIVGESSSTDATSSSAPDGALDIASSSAETSDNTGESTSDSTDSNNILPFVGKPKDDTQTSPEAPQTAVAAGGGAAAVAKKSGPQEVVRINSDLLEELVNLAGETSISRSRLEEQVTEFRNSLDEVDSTIERLQEQLRRLDIETEAQVLFRQEQMAVHEESFDPLEMDRYSHLQQLSRSLMESASDLYDLRSDLSDKVKDAETTLLQQSRINTVLQEGLMRSRMVPFSRLVPRLRRIVRQVASELGKKVSFELDNVEGELDRNVLERMVPPFEHMLRNAVDHGIESPEERVEKGKPETGRIILTLGREGGNVIIRLADDGRGVDLQRVRNKAIERGLMDADANLSDLDVMQFILHAGFSTAESVTQISGRGVGMDVVNAEIKQLGGDVTINSEWGKGTEFVVHLPFTLSVNRALMVEVGKDQYAIPLNTIEGIVRVSPFELDHYYNHPDTEFEYANDKFKVRYLGGLLHGGRKANLEGHILPLPVILVRSAQHTMALQVDSLMGSREIVVKSLGAQFSSVQGLSGATIMGDGSVVLILDPHALVRQEIAKADLLVGATTKAQLELASDTAISNEPETVPTVMVVDDSVTVRKVMTRFLEREGYNVITAKDGVDALGLLQDELPDLMLLDIEMPRMDGFEVAKNVRGSQRMKHLPIIMITSRTGDKHRDHALSLGVNQYMGKPYQEDALLESIKELTEQKASR